MWSSRSPLPELMARVRAILRRTSLGAHRLGAHRRRHRARPRVPPGDVGTVGRCISGPPSFACSNFSMQSPGRVFSRAQLLDGVWGRNVYVDERTVDVHIGRLRKAMMRGAEQDPVRTVRGAGYAFSATSWKRPSEGQKEAPNEAPRPAPSLHLTEAAQPRSVHSHEVASRMRPSYRAAATAPADRQAVRDARNREPSRTSCGRRNEIPPRPDRRWASGTSLLQGEDGRPLGGRDVQLFDRRRLRLDLLLISRLERDIAARAEQQDGARCCRGACARRGLGLDERELVARPESPRRCTLPITAFRVTPPRRLAIWLALKPSAQSFSVVRPSHHSKPWLASSF